MTLFLLTILGIYGAVHVYAFLKVKAAFPFGVGMGMLLAVFMAAMICAPILVRLLSRQGYESLARLIAYIGYSWMGFLFLFFSISLRIPRDRSWLPMMWVLLFSSLLFLRSSQVIVSPSSKPSIFSGTLISTSAFAREE